MESLNSIWAVNVCSFVFTFVVRDKDGSTLLKVDS